MIISNNYFKLILGLSVALFLNMLVGVSQVSAVETYDYFADDVYNLGDEIENVVASPLDYRGYSGVNYEIVSDSYDSSPYSISAGYSNAPGSVQIAVASSSQLYFKFDFKYNTDSDPIQSTIFFDDRIQTGYTYLYSFAGLAIISGQESDWDYPFCSSDMPSSTNDIHLYFHNPDHPSCSFDRDCDCQLVFDDLSTDVWNQVEFYVDTELNVARIRVNATYWVDVEPEFLTSANEFDDLRAITVKDDFRNYGPEVRNHYKDNFVVNSEYDEDYAGLDIEVIDLPAYDGDSTVGWSSGLEYAQRFNCSLNENCFYPVRYGYDQIGGTLYLIPNNGLSQPIYDPESLSSTSSELIMNSNLTVGWNLASSTVGSAPYCLYYMASDYVSNLDSLYCDIEIYYGDWTTLWDEDEWDWISCDDVCDDLATTSDEWFGISIPDFAFGINCGLRQTACWAFMPSRNSIEALQKATAILKKQFPMTVLYPVYDTLYEYSLMGTSTAQISLDPLFPGSQNDLVVFEADTIPNYLGDIWTDYMFPTMEYGLYLLTFLYFIRFIYKDSSGIQEDRRHLMEAQYVTKITKPRHKIQRFYNINR